MPATMSIGILTIEGTNGDDLATVSIEGGSVRVIENGRNQYFSFDVFQPRHIVFRGYNGNDRFVNSTGLVSTAFGMGGADVLIGGATTDTFHGGDGNDDLSGGDGAVWLAGENGADVLRGERGNDKLVGENGSDKLYGSAGNDLLLGAFWGPVTEIEGYDYLDGEDGDDRLFGGNGRDRVYGGTGNDLIRGGALNFHPRTGSSAPHVSDWNYDYLYGGPGADVIYVGDAKFFGWYWDKAMDATSADSVKRFGIGLGSFPSPLPRWGHLYGT